DDVETTHIREWERGFHAFISASRPQVGEKIRTQKALTKDIEAELKAALDAYKQTAGTGSAKFTAASL
ncbi:MAG: hypothetical protein KGJ70_09800, partial [Gemmatimonadota bacterium]|nr:hypothetical protein [Gemmatimonadota bacterium]